MHIEPKILKWIELNGNIGALKWRNRHFYWSIETTLVHTNTKVSRARKNAYFIKTLCKRLTHNINTHTHAHTHEMVNARQTKWTKWVAFERFLHDSLYNEHSSQFNWYIDWMKFVVRCWSADGRVCHPNVSLNMNGASFFFPSSFFYCTTNYYGKIN